MKLNGSELLIQCLLKENVEVIFGYPGGAIMPTYDALAKNNLRHILVRHEQGAVHAAEGYARTAQKPGVCIATSGPGATNLITGIADAMLDSVPLVCITGQVMSSLLGTDAFQEVDIISMTLPITKWNMQITTAEQIPQAVEYAFYISQQGRPGPVLLDITKNAQLGMCTDFTSPSTKEKNKATSLTLDVDLIRDAAALINTAKKPYFLIGQGVLIARAELEAIALAEKTHMPVASTLLGLSAFPSHHPLFKGMLGMHGSYASNLLTNEADVILAVGMRFDDRVTSDLKRYAKNAKIIHIDIDESELNKNVAATIAIHADAKLALRELLSAVNENNHAAWHQAFDDYYQQEFNAVIKSEIYVDTGAIKMAEFIHQLSNKTQGNAIIVTDVGQHQMSTARYYQFSQTLSHITSGGAGTMGFALPAAIGAKVANPERTVIAIIGDGGFQMTIQELAVLKQENLAVKIIILNNQHLGMVRQWQELFFDERYSHVKLCNPDFIKIAEGYGIAGQRLSERQNITTAIHTLLTANTSYVLEVMVEDKENIFPMIQSGASVSEMRLS